MKKLFFAMACLLGFIGVQAQEIENADIVVLSKVTLDSLKSLTETGNQTYYFDSKCKGITMTMNGRDPKRVLRQGFKDGLNFKNNTYYTITTVHENLLTIS